MGQPRMEVHGRPMSAPDRPAFSAGKGGDAMRDAQADVPSA